MSTVVFHRPPRRHGPVEPRGEIAFEAPPDVPQQLPRSIAQLLMILPMLAGVGAMAFLYAGRSGGTMTWVAGGLFGVSMLGMGLSTMTGGGGDRRAKLDAERRDYMRYLAQMRRRVRRVVTQQRATTGWTHPEPDALWSIAASSRMWERRPGDDDFGHVRLGLGPKQLAINMISPETKPVEDLEPLSAVALRRFMQTFQMVPDVPAAASLRRFSRVVLRGDRDASLALARSVLCQLATFHAPDELRIAVVTSGRDLHEWDWVKWFPHAQYPRRSDAAGAARLVFPSMAALEDLLGEELSTRPRHSPDAKPMTDLAHLVVVLDGGEMKPDAQLAGQGVQGVTLIDLSGAVPRDPDDEWLLALEVDREQVEMLQHNRLVLLCRPDRLSREQAEGLARQLAPYRQSAQVGPEEAVGRAFELVDLVGVRDAGTLDARRSWRANKPNRERLRLPLGLGPGGNVVELDLKEAAQEGMGPHGLIIGATGSGKSELLRTIVAGLAMTHSTEELNFVLVDFKGGATFASLDVLPHTSAVITNLEDELPLVDRMQDALSGELTRRQELLRAAGNYVSQYEYERARRAGEPLEPLPSLLIICDEFSELLAAKPDFIDLFVTIGRLGRSLGVHLLLASQRLEEGKLRGLDVHLSYRIGLRTFSPVESRIVLGVPDAYELPNAPGHGYLKTDTSTMLRFRAAYVSGPYEPVARGHLPEAVVSRQVVRYVAQHVPVPAGPAAAAEQAPAEPEHGGKRTTVLEVVAERLRGQGVPAHQVWLPPLSEPAPLNALLPPLGTDPPRGLCPVGWPELGRLRVPVGMVDKPFEQRRDWFEARLDGAGGNVVIVGGPQSGKSTLLRTLLCSLALTHTPRQAQFFCLDFGGGTLAALRDLPHVGGVALVHDPERVRRTVAETRAVLAAREARFTELGIDSIATYRRRRNDGEFPDDPFGDLFLVVDGWGTVREDFEEYEQAIISLAQRGLSYGVHVILTAARWSELRMNLRDLLGTRFELRLGDPGDSEIDRRAALNVPDRTPGRGITPERLHFLSALPRVDGKSTVDDLADGVAGLVTAVRAAWDGPVPPRVRLLPRQLPAAGLPAADRPHTFALGLDERDLGPVFLDFAADSHLLVLGDSGAGKTNVLRVLAREIVRRHPPGEARLIIGDYRRSLLGAVDGEHLLELAPSAAKLREAMSEAAAALRNRLPGPDVTAEQLSDRGWWQGPELYVLVDDYDLVSGVGGNPLAELAEFLPQARDIGLHLIVARRVGGASRAMYEPVLQRLRELDNPALLLSGNPDEGPLLGNLRPSVLPPGRGTLVRRNEGNQLIQVAWSG